MNLRLTFPMLSMLFLLRSISSSNVLVIPHPYAVSHVRLLYSLAERLLQNGHNVTSLRWAATEAVAAVQVPPGVNVIDYHVARQEWVLTFLDKLLWTVPESTIYYFQFIAHHLSFQTAVEPCQVFAAQPELLDYLQAQQYDLIYLDPFAQPCNYAIANQIGVAYISITPTMGVYYLDQDAAVPVPLSYVPSLPNGYSDQMNFWQRIVNLWDTLILVTSYWRYIEYFLPSVVPEWTNVKHRPLVQLTLTNRLIEFPRPSTLTMHDCGQKPKLKESNEELVPQHTLDDQSHGTVILSLTTLGSARAMPEYIKVPFSHAVSQLSNYRVVWRNLKANEPISFQNHSHVYETHWYNQPHTIAHKNTKLLITHAGLATVLEAVTHGVPMLTMPLGADQYANAARMHAKGLGLPTWQFKCELKSDVIVNLANEMLSNTKYRETAEKFSLMIEDEKELMGEQFIWWLEYGIRHGQSLRRLRAVGEDQFLFKYYSADLFFSCICVVVLLVATLNTI